MATLAPLAKRFQSGFRLINGDDLNALLDFLNVPPGKYAAATNTAAFTATGAQVAGAQNVTLNLTGTLAAGRAIQMPTALAIVAAIPNAYVGETYILTIQNTSSANFAWTVTTNTGITLTGTVTIAQNTQRSFLVTLTSLTAVAVQSLGQTALT